MGSSFRPLALYTAVGHHLLCTTSLPVGVLGEVILVASPVLFLEELQLARRHAARTSAPSGITRHPPALVASRGG